MNLEGRFTHAVHKVRKKIVVVNPCIFDKFVFDGDRTNGRVDCRSNLIGVPFPEYEQSRDAAESTDTSLALPFLLLQSC